MTGRDLNRHRRTDATHNLHRLEDGCTGTTGDLNRHTGAQAHTHDRHRLKDDAQALLAHGHRQAQTLTGSKMDAQALQATSTGSLARRWPLTGSKMDARALLATSTGSQAHGSDPHRHRLEDGCTGTAGDLHGITGATLAADRLDDGCTGTAGDLNRLTGDLHRITGDLHGITGEMLTADRRTGVMQQSGRVSRYLAIDGLLIDCPPPQNQIKVGAQA